MPELGELQKNGGGYGIRKRPGVRFRPGTLLHFTLTKKTEKEQIKKYADAFFDVVNLRVYNYLIKNQLSSCDLDVIEYELVDWLLQHPELKDWVKHPYEKRKIAAEIFNVALAMNEKSPNLNYCWREFSLK